MSESLQAVVAFLCLLSTSIWVGGYVTIVVVAGSATRTLDPAARVDFFRDLGRGYFWVGTPALVVALVSGWLLVRRTEHDALLLTAAVLALVLVVAFAIAVAQARRMTRLRQRLVDAPDDAELAAMVRSGAAKAGALRGLLGLLSIALLVIGTLLAT